MVLIKEKYMLLKFYQIYSHIEKKYYNKSHLWEKNNQIFFWFLFSCTYLCAFTKKFIMLIRLCNLNIYFNYYEHFPITCFKYFNVYTVLHYMGIAQFIQSIPSMLGIWTVCIFKSYKMLWYTLILCIYFNYFLRINCYNRIIGLNN